MLWSGGNNNTHYLFDKKNKNQHNNKQKPPNFQVLSVSSEKNIKKALKELLKNPKLKGIVFDLRDMYHCEHQFLAYFTDTILKTTNFSYPVKTTTLSYKILRQG
jgi:hypothetical protein